MQSSATKLVEELGRFGIVEWIDSHTLIVHVDRGKLRDIAKYLHWGIGGYFSVSIGSDERPLDNSFHVYHVFSLDHLGVYVVVDIRVSPGYLHVPSITPIIPGANWHEREVMDYFGIMFDDHPEPKRLILPYNWPKGVYPLRKDYPYNKKVYIEEASDEPEHDSRFAGKYTIIPIGPYHPALHEPEYFELYVDGERIVGARYKGFMVHRGMEKIAESRMTINQIPFLAERICGICGYTHNVAYCQAVENVAGIDVPERAHYIRSIMLEIERIHSHMLWLGIAFHFLGFDTGFMITWRLREKVMDLAEMLTGNRKTYGLNLIGGVRRDIDLSKALKVKKVLRDLRKDYVDYMEKILGLKEIIYRTRGVGVLDYGEARKYSVLGPTARASGIDTDVRKYHPYAAYRHVDFKIPVYKDGDVLSRILVRHEEIIESINIIEQLLDNLPRTPIMAEEIHVPEHRIGVGVTEAPRGEDIHFVITSRDNKIYRWRPRAPSYNNIPALLVMLKDQHLADAPIIIASIDPCFSCTDHVLIIDVRTGSRKQVGLRELSRRGLG